MVHRLVSFIVLFAVLCAPVFAQNAADVYGNAVNNATGIGSDMTAETRRALEEIGLRGWKSAPGVVSLINDNVGVLDSMVQASALKNANFNPTNMSEIDRPLINIGQLRDLAYVLIARSRWKASNGDMKGAVTDIEGVMALSRHLMNDRILIYKVLALTILQQATPSVQALQAQPAMRKWLASYSLPPFSRFMADEKQSYLDVITHMSRQPEVGGLGDAMVKYAPVYAGKYFVLNAPSLQPLQQQLQKKYGTTDADDILVKVKSAPQSSWAAGAQDVDAAVVLVRYASVARIKGQYDKVQKALAAARQGR